MKYIHTSQDAAIEQEITALQESPYVRLAQLYDTVRSQRMRLLQELRDLEERGKDLSVAGITVEDLESLCQFC